MICNCSSVTLSQATGNQEVWSLTLIRLLYATINNPNLFGKSQTDKLESRAERNSV